jgi:uncharacterized protein YehS (DUF1456 family)
VQTFYPTPKIDMRNEDVLRSIRYMMKITDEEMTNILKLAEVVIPVGRMEQILKKEDFDGKRDDAASDELTASFLDGLIIKLRGKDDKHPPQPFKAPLTNNTILKKLRVAFSLRDDDMHSSMEAGGFPITKPEMSAFFRKEGQKNYRECKDQVLRYFLKGLTMRIRK